MMIFMLMSLPLFQILGVEAKETTEEIIEGEVIREEGFEVDAHHVDHKIKANFVPQNILNPDDSTYKAPKGIKDYVGTHTAEVEVPELDVQLNVIVSVEEDGIFNLAHYFINKEDKKGLRFYVDKQGTLKSMDAIYQDLVVLTGGLKEAEGGLGSGLIQKTISPVVLLDTQGQAKDFYPYHIMAYELRDNYQNARVYQNVGLYGVDGKLVVDINHLIGLKEGEPIKVSLNAVEESPDQFLVEKRTYDILQDSFDNHLNDYNDFNLTFDSENMFVQIIQAMHLKTNASFPKETTFELVEPEKVNKKILGDHAYSLLINKEILYFYDGESLFISNEFTEENGTFTVTRWKTN